MTVPPIASGLAFNMLIGFLWKRINSERNMRDTFCVDVTADGEQQFLWSVI